VKNLLNIFFSKDVLTEFSWTGVSRTPGIGKKEAFQACSGILNIISEMAIMADSRWNTTKNENFFKLHILKHAKQINEAAKKKLNKIATPMLPHPECNISVDNDVNDNEISQDV